ncbi:uncharacterized protein LOC130238772 [Danio aesculapii]|uniref:uncharacterized protein LOC130238772 n=1 Tax=Danio aesculapii TaxID=1142201 RepID=UPI0024BFA66A|nr:uncharacterized protein LOC130238772 [Danio aesculapii]
MDVVGTGARPVLSLVHQPFKYGRESNQSQEGVKLDSTKEKGVSGRKTSTIGGGEGETQCSEETKHEIFHLQRWRRRRRAAPGAQVTVSTWLRSLDLSSDWLLGEERERRARVSSKAQSGGAGSGHQSKTASKVTVAARHQSRSGKDQNAERANAGGVSRESARSLQYKPRKRQENQQRTRARSSRPVSAAAGVACGCCHANIWHVERIERLQTRITAPTDPPVAPEQEQEFVILCVYNDMGKRPSSVQ